MVISLIAQTHCSIKYKKNMSSHLLTEEMYGKMLIYSFDTIA